MTHYVRKAILSKYFVNTLRRFEEDTLHPNRLHRHLAKPQCDIHDLRAVTKQSKNIR